MNWNNGYMADIAYPALFFSDPCAAQHGCLGGAAYCATQDPMQCSFLHHPAPQYPGMSRRDGQDPVPDSDTTMGWPRLRRVRRKG